MSRRESLGLGIRRARIVGSLVAVFSVGPAAASDGFLVDYRADLQRTGQKLAELAEAIPESKYGWAPNEDVRSVARVILHVSATNFHLAAKLGAIMPDDLPEDLEAVEPQKNGVVTWFRRSVATLEAALEGENAASLDERVEVFGRQRSRRSVHLMAGGHVHEHLGQLIAYARSNGIVPPWSR